MAKVDTQSPVQGIHGKLSRKEDIYYYRGADGKTKSRKRKETYQQENTPKRKWTRTAFGYAQKTYNDLLFREGWQDLYPGQPYPGDHEDPTEVQKWKNSLSKEQKNLLCNAGRTHIEAEYKASDRKNVFGRLQHTAKSWKFGWLVAQWKAEHPFESWAQAYLEEQSAKTEAILSAANPSEYAIDQQIMIEEERLARLKALKAQRSGK